jgi:hypothetical protein
MSMAAPAAGSGEEGDAADELGFRRSSAIAARRWAAARARSLKREKAPARRKRRARIRIQREVEDSCVLGKRMHNHALDVFFYKDQGALKLVFFLAIIPPPTSSISDILS